MRNRQSLEYAKSMRTNATPAEARLWHQLRAHRFEGYKFRRQTVIGPYIADFTCRAAMLVLEVDGDTHGNTGIEDARRTAFLQEQGWRVVRFTNAEVMANIEGVLDQLRRFLQFPSP